MKNTQTDSKMMQKAKQMLHVRFLVDKIETWEFLR